MTTLYLDPLPIFGHRSDGTEINHCYFLVHYVGVYTHTFLTSIISHISMEAIAAPASVSVSQKNNRSISSMQRASACTDGVPCSCLSVICFGAPFLVVCLAQLLTDSSAKKLEAVRGRSAKA